MGTTDFQPFDFREDLTVWVTKNEVGNRFDLISMPIAMDDCPLA
jgi:hypothetical protein